MTVNIDIFHYVEFSNRTFRKPDLFPVVFKGRRDSCSVDPGRTRRRTGENTEVSEHMPKL
jgi:hypothetical protein